MGFRRVTLVVMLYLALDLANPMMPGAFQLVDGSLEIVAGCQARSATAPEPAAAALPRRLAIIAPQREPARPAGRIVSVSSPIRIPVRTPLEPSSIPASSSDDD